MSMRPHDHALNPVVHMAIPKQPLFMNEIGFSTLYPWNHLNLYAESIILIQADHENGFSRFNQSLFFSRICPLNSKFLAIEI